MFENYQKFIISIFFLAKKMYALFIESMIFCKLRLVIKMRLFVLIFKLCAHHILLGCLTLFINGSDGNPLLCP